MTSTGALSTFYPSPSHTFPLVVLFNSKSYCAVVCFSIVYPLYHNTHVKQASNHAVSSPFPHALRVNTRDIRLTCCRLPSLAELDLGLALRQASGKEHQNGGAHNTAVVLPPNRWSHPLPGPYSSTAAALVSTLPQEHNDADPMKPMSQTDLLPTDLSHPNHGIRRFGFRHNPYRRGSRTSSVCSSIASSYPELLDSVKMERTSSLSSWDDSDRSHAPSPTLCETTQGSPISLSLTQGHARRCRNNAQPEDERKTKKAATERVARGVQGDWIKMMEQILIDYGIKDMTLLNENNAKNSNLTYKKTEIMQNTVELVFRLEREGAEKDEIINVIQDRLEKLRHKAHKLQDQLDCSQDEIASLKEENTRLKRQIQDLMDRSKADGQSLPLRCSL